MAGKTLSYFNLTGGLNTVNTMATINATPNRTESPDMVNVEYFKLSGIRTMNGNVGLNSSNSISNDYETNRINFGYEYIKGDKRYMIVADAQSLYEYNPFTDTFTTLISFEADGNGITMCGYANGVVAASPSNNYLIYYRKDRSSELALAQVTTDGTTTISINSYGSNLVNCSEDILGKGDLITINNIEYEVEEVQPEKIKDPQDPSQWITNPNKDTFKVTTAASTITANLFITDFTKIYCTYKSIVDNGDNTTTETVINFMPKVVQSHQGRIWVGATIESEQTAAYLIYSDLGNIHNAFEGGDASSYDAGYFAEFWEDTSDITAIGTWDKYIVCHKREHTYLIDTSNSDATQWNVQSYSEYTCDNQSGFVKANNGYYTYCSTVGGIYPMIQRTIYSAISQGAEASTKIRDTFLNINNYALDEIYAVYHPYKKYIMFYLPMIGEEGSNNCYILDLQTKSWLHRRIPQRVTTAFEFDNKVYVGTADGKIFEEFRGTSFDGQPINFSWKSPWFIWGGATNWTTTREFRVKMSQEGTNNFYIRNRRDGIEDYKQRTITNTSNQVSSLFWDAAVLTDDLNPDYIDTFRVYSYTGDDSKTYYGFESPLQNTTFLHEYTGSLPEYIPISLQGATAAGALAYERLATKEEIAANDFDRAVWGTGTRFAFKYTPTLPKYICYQSTQDPNIMAWITRTNPTTIDTSKAIVNVEIKTTFVGITLNTVQFKIAPDLLASIEEAQASGIQDRVYYSGNYPEKFFSQMKNGQWVNTITERTNGVTVIKGSCIFINSKPSGSSTRANFVGGAYAKVGSDIIPLATYAGQTSLTRNPNNTEAGEVWNGKHTRSGMEKTISSYSVNSIVIDGVTFNRYSSGDEGSMKDTPNIIIVYSDKEKPTVGTPVYNDTDLTDEYGKVTSISGDGYNVSGRVFYPSTADNQAGLDATYYVTKPVFPDIGTIEYVGTNTGSFVVVPPPYYEDNNYADDVRFLTDSRWDGNEEFTINGVTYPASYSRNAQGTVINNPPSSTPPDSQNTWVNTGQITKRFPIDRQYFQTLQIEFCGETEDQGIELYGFEVDGIQLTEVPY